MERWLKGSTAEAAVGETLEPLRWERYIVMHDMPQRGEGNIDHVVSGPNGVYLVETKFARYLPVHLKKAKRQAARLHDELGVWVTPVVSPRDPRHEVVPPRGRLGRQSRRAGGLDPRTAERAGRLRPSRAFRRIAAQRSGRAWRVSDPSGRAGRCGCARRACNGGGIGAGGLAHHDLELAERRGRAALHPLAPPLPARSRLRRRGAGGDRRAPLRRARPASREPPRRRSRADGRDEPPPPGSRLGAARGGGRLGPHQGVQKLELHVFPHNVGAIRLYERFGFEREGYRKRHYHRPDGFVDAILMAYEVSPRRKSA